MVILAIDIDIHLQMKCILRGLNVYSGIHYTFYMDFVRPTISPVNVISLRGGDQARFVSKM